MKAVDAIHGKAAPPRGNEAARFFLDFSQVLATDPLRGSQKLTNKLTNQLTNGRLLDGLHRIICLSV
jgi:hypothetical protein